VFVRAPGYGIYFWKGKSRVKNFLSRLGITLVIIWSGPHVAGIGMSCNGSARKGNSVWDALSAFYDWEIDVVTWLVYIALGGAALYAVYYVLFERLPASRAKQNLEHLEKERIKIDIEAGTRAAAAELEEWAAGLSRAKAFKAIIAQGPSGISVTPVSGAKPAPTVPRSVPNPPPKPRLTPQELKKKAIEQLLRR
jgi:hypothetical protein